LRRRQIEVRIEFDFNPAAIVFAPETPIKLLPRSK